MMFTEDEYDQFLDYVDPDDIKILWEIRPNDDAFRKLCDLHDESKCVLDFCGRQEFSEAVANRLAIFVRDLEDFLAEYQEQTEVNAEIIERLTTILGKVPESLLALSFEQD